MKKTENTETETHNPNGLLVCVWEACFVLPKRTFYTSQTHVLRFNRFLFLSKNVWLFLWTVHIVHCLQTHKFHFSITFLLKMGLIVLFTHLKIILLRCFSIFSFSFQLYPNELLIKCANIKHPTSLRFQLNICLVTTDVRHCEIRVKRYSYL